MRERPFYLAFGGMAAMAAGMGIGRFVYTPILPEMAEDFDLSSGETGLIASANFAGYLLGALFAGSGRFGARPRFWLIVALLANAVCLAGMGLTDRLDMFLGLRFLAGAASAFMLVFTSSLVLERLANAGRSDLAALHFAGVGTGIAISAVAMTLATDMGIDAAGQWLMSAGLAGVGMLLVIVLVPPDPGPVSPESHPKPSRITSTAGGRGCLVAAYGLFGFGYIITATFIVAIVRDDPAMAAAEPMLWTLFGLVAAPSVFIWSHVARRAGTLNAFAIACLVEAFGVALTVLWPSLAGVLLGAALLGATFMGLTALGLTAIRTLDPNRTRQGLAIMTAAFGFGQIVGPAFAGLYHDRFGDFTVPTLMAAGALVLAAGLARSLERRRAPSGPARPV